MCAKILLLVRCTTTMYTYVNIQTYTMHTQTLTYTNVYTQVNISKCVHIYNIHIQHTHINLYK